MRPRIKTQPGLITCLGLPRRNLMPLPVINPERGVRYLFIEALASKPEELIKATRTAIYRYQRYCRTHRQTW